MKSKNISEFKQNNVSEKNWQHSSYIKTRINAVYSQPFFSLHKKYIIEAQFKKKTSNVPHLLVCIVFFLLSSLFVDGFWLIMRICSQQLQRSFLKRKTLKYQHWTKFTGQRRFRFAFWCGTRYLLYARDQQSSTSSLYVCFSSKSNKMFYQKKNYMYINKHGAAS